MRSHGIHGKVPLSNKTMEVEETKQVMDIIPPTIMEADILGPAAIGMIGRKVQLEADVVSVCLGWGLALGAGFSEPSGIPCSET